MNTRQATASLLRNAKDKAGISTPELSQRAGILYSTLRRLLLGQSRFNVNQLCAIAAALQVRPSSLLGVGDEGEAEA